LPVRGKGRIAFQALETGAGRAGWLTLMMTEKPMPPRKTRRYLKHGSLPQLRVFEAVVRHGSFTRAAEELHLSQPTVSVQVRKLTETAGVPLLEPIGKRVQPTTAGRALYEACRDIFDTLACVEDVLAGLRVPKEARPRASTGAADW
jgi:DNA-binding MarR family transcriptional regulator